MNTPIFQSYIFHNLIGTYYSGFINLNSSYFHFCNSIPQHLLISQKYLVLASDFKLKNKGERYAPKYPLVNTNSLQQKKRKTHLFKSSFSCKLSCFRYCIQSAQRVRRPVRCQYIRLKLLSSCWDHIFELFTQVGAYKKTWICDILNRIPQQLLIIWFYSFLTSDFRS